MANHVTSHTFVFPTANLQLLPLQPTSSLLLQVVSSSELNQMSSQSSKTTSSLRRQLEKADLRPVAL